MVNFNIQLFIHEQSGVFTLLSQIITENPKNIGNIVPSVIFSQVGHNASFHCISMTVPLWWKKEGKLNHDNTRESKYRLLLMDLKVSESGRYYCNGTKLNHESFTSYGDLYVGGWFC